MKKLIIASMDIEKYYRNIISKPSARIIEEGIEDLVYKKEVKEKKKKKTVTKKVGKKHGHQQWWESRHSYCS